MLPDYQNTKLTYAKTLKKLRIHVLQNIKL